MKKLNIGLKEGILINITILLISALLLLGFALLKITENILVKQQSQTARAFISSIQNSITYMYQTNPTLSFSDLMQSPAIRRLLGVYTNGDRFSLITIVNRDLEIIYSSENLSSPSKLNRKDFKPSVWQGNTKIQINRKNLLFRLLDEESILEIYSPIFFGNEIKAGIIAKIPLSPLKTEITKMRRLAFIFIAVDAIVFIIFGWLLLSKGVIKPIRKLLKATEEISKGAFSYRIEMKEEFYEVNNLAKSFNMMTERLGEKTEDLNKTIEMLKQSNQELQTAQKGLIRSEKLALTGRLAAGLAHEIGNPIGSITAYLDYLLKDKNIKGKNKDCLKRLEKEVGRIDVIVREFLDLASPPRGIIKEIDLNKTISNTVTLLKHRNDFKHVNIKQDIPGTLLPVKLDEQKIQQVLYNVLLNAADAIEENGRITINSKISEHAEKIELTILDNGSGIEKEALLKIFDPFFTTKEPGKGTGLGLSICQKIVTDMDGEITVESSSGKGTKVKILIPWKH